MQWHDYKAIILYVCMYVCMSYIALQYAELYYLDVFFHCPAARFVASEPEEKKEVCIGTLLAMYLVLLCSCYVCPQIKESLVEKPKKEKYIYRCASYTKPVKNIYMHLSSASMSELRSVGKTHRFKSWLDLNVFVFFSPRYRDA